MKTLIALLLLSATALGLAQDHKSLYRLRIQHADPQLVYLLLSGRATFMTPPELSTLTFGRGLGSGNGGFGNTGPGGGRGG